MKLSKETMLVLKNFKNINPSIAIDPGNVLKTISPSKTVMAKATLTDEFPLPFAIYNLDRFLSVSSLYNDPEFEFENEFVRIGTDTSSTHYTFADASLIKRPPEKEIKLPSIDAEAVIKQTDLDAVMRACGILGLPEIAIECRAGTMKLKAFDSKNPTGDSFSNVIGENDNDFTAVYKVENLGVYDGDYKVAICSAGISYFKNVDKDIEYWIAVEQNSTF